MEQLRELLWSELQAEDGHRDIPQGIASVGLFEIDKEALFLVPKDVVPKEVSMTKMLLSGSVAGLLEPVGEGLRGVQLLLPVVGMLLKKREVKGCGRRGKLFGKGDSVELGEAGSDRLELRGIEG